MKICFLCNQIAAWGKIGGFGTNLRRLGSALAREGIDVHVVVPRRRGQRRVEQLDGMTVHGQSLREVFFGTRLYRDIDADIYHTQEPNLCGYWAQRVLPGRVHLVTSMDPRDNDDWQTEFRHATWSRRLKYPVQRFYEDGSLVRHAVTAADGVYVEASFLREKAQRLYGLSALPNVLPKPIPVPVGPFQKAERPLCVFLARFDPRKKPLTFIQLAKQMPDVDFVAVGTAHDSAYQRFLESQASGVKNLTLAGFLDPFRDDRLFDLLSRAWVLVHPAAREGLPTAFQEASVHEMAVLAEVDPDGYVSRFGRVVPAGGDLQVWEESLRNLLESGSWRDLGRAGREWNIVHHAVNVSVTAHLESYREHLSRKLHHGDTETRSTEETETFRPSDCQKVRSRLVLETINQRSQSLTVSKSDSLPSSVSPCLRGGFPSRALAALRSVARRWLPDAPARKPQGAAGVAQLGHRDYVGGQWDTIGRLQFEFLCSQGLRPEHHLLDVACGSLRAGMHFIPYLEPEHYLGVDKEQSLIDAGISQELGNELHSTKRPQFVVSGDFEFERFAVQPDFVLAHSLFTHLPPTLIVACLKKLRPCVHQNARFFATFFETPTPRANPHEPHDHATFLFTRDEMQQFGEEAGWQMEYIGDWNHPRGQKMVAYSPNPTKLITTETQRHGQNTEDYQTFRPSDFGMKQTNSTFCVSDQISESLTVLKSPSLPVSVSPSLRGESSDIRDGLFFIVGHHRGGTTLLQSMLTSHSALTLPPETGFFEEVWTRRGQFGDLTDERNLQRMLEFLESSACSVSDLEIDRHELAAAFRQTGRGYDDLFVTLLTLYAESRGKRRVGEKSPQHIHYVSTIAELFPQARFITLLRDPRAVVNSEMQTNWGSRSAGRIMKRWRRVVDRHVQLLNTLPPNRYRMVQYEHLLAEPEQILRELCGFLGEDFEPAMLQFFDRPAEERGFRSDEAWKHNTLQPLSRERTDAWQTELTPTIIRLIERSAGSRLTALGYLPANIPTISGANYASQWCGDRATWLKEVVTAVARGGRPRRRPWRDAIAEAARELAAIK